MDRIEACARMSILKALGFVAMGVGTLMVGLSYDMALALTAGAYLMGLTAIILALKGGRAARRDYRRTETWLLLERRHGLPEDRAQRVIGGILRELYLRYARISGGLAVVTWLVGQGVCLVA